MKFFNFKYILVLSVLFILPTSFIESAVFINEVQIKPTEERFVELYNSGSSEVDLTGWYLQRKTATSESFGSLVSKKYFENKNIPAKGFFVISKTDSGQTDVVFETLTLTESNTIQLKNSNQEVVSVVGWGDVSGSLVSNPGEGKSISLNDNDWIIGEPTKGEENTGEEDDGDTDEEDEDGEEKDNVILKINSKIIIPKTIISGIPFLLGGEVKSNKGGTYHVGKFVWNFGDGMSYQFKDSSPFNYTYEYDGEYMLSLSYFDNIFDELPESSSSMKVKVIPAEILISSVGDYRNPYVEIENKTSYDISLSGWMIKAGNKSFVFPDGTFILSKNKIKISPKITGFTGSDLSQVSISSPNLIINSIYPSVSFSKSKVAVNTTLSNKVVSQEVAVETETKEMAEEEKPIDLNLLTASAGDAQEEKGRMVYPIVGLVVVIVLGVTSFLLLKKKKEPTDDFDLVE